MLESQTGCEAEHAQTESAASCVQNDAANRTLVLIGMRGAGKTHLGNTAAKALSRAFIDLDHLYEARHGSILETAKTLGWGYVVTSAYSFPPALRVCAYISIPFFSVFREREVALLKEMLEQHPNGAVIATGGGIVETEPGRALLRAHWPVVQVRTSLRVILHEQLNEEAAESEPKPQRFV